jgi:hypothetical protein
MNHSFHRRRMVLQRPNADPFELEPSARLMRLQLYVPRLHVSQLVILEDGLSIDAHPAGLASCSQLKQEPLLVTDVGIFGSLEIVE